MLGREAPLMRVSCESVETGESLPTRDERCEVRSTRNLNDRCEAHVGSDPSKAGSGHHDGMIPAGDECEEQRDHETGMNQAVSQ